MSQGKDLTQEERKAKEYVDFYYFWQFQYLQRLGRVWMRKESRIKKELLKITSDLIPAPDDTWIHDHFPDTKSGIVPCIDVTANHFQPYSDVLCCAGACKNQDCPARERVLTLCKDFFNADIREENGEKNFFEGITSSIDIQLTAEDILKCVANDTGCTPASFGYCNRSNNNYGFDIIGLQESSLDEDKCFDGRIILSVDMSVDLEILKGELSSLKKLTFTQPPIFEKICMEFEQGKKNYLFEKKIIESREGVAFDPSDMRSRAVGLWFYESIVDLKVFRTVKEAHEALLRGTWTAKAIQSGVSETGCLKTPLDRLGYSASEVSIFCRLLRNTKRCVNTNEVLSLSL